MSPTITPAGPADAASIGEVSVLAWQSAYRGLMPDDYLDALDAGERAGRWVDPLGTPPARTTVLMATDRGRHVGFAAVGPCWDDEGLGELYAINVRPDVWGSGVGTELLQAATEALRDTGFGQAILWVLPGNTRARRFYESHGWHDDQVQRDAEAHDIVVTEVRYRTRL